jgi:hypothetical protein
MEVTTGGQRRTQTFAASGEGQDLNQVATPGKKRQPSLSELPFSEDTFKDICNIFRIHKSFAKTVTRTDVPSFHCEKVNMPEPAYGKPVQLGRTFILMLTQAEYTTAALRTHGPQTWLCRLRIFRLRD